jgi:hypothetical protein
VPGGLGGIVVLSRLLRVHDGHSARVRALSGPPSHGQGRCGAGGQQGLVHPGSHGLVGLGHPRVAHHATNATHASTMIMALRAGGKGRALVHLQLSPRGALPPVNA